MLNNQQPCQAIHSAQSSAASHMPSFSKTDDGQQSFESKLSEQIDSGNGEKKLMKVTDKHETSEAVPPVLQSITANPQVQTSSVKDLSVASSVSIASRQQGDLPRLAKTRADSGRARLIENDFEMKSSKLSSLEGVEAKLMLGGNGLSASPLGVPSSSDGAGVSAQTLLLAKVAPELSMKNSPSAFEVQLTTPFRDPQFESSFASQVSFLTNQGITHAKIHLNPQDMGPVSVDIRSVGDSVEVNFQAAREQTRQAIEASIDTLRGLMREEGMTLQNAFVRSIEVAPAQAMAASSEQRSNDFQFDRASQFDDFAKNFHQNSRGQRQLNDQSSTALNRTGIASEQPSVGQNNAMIPRRLTGIDLFA
jgi:flagellar hook-length control protein FliK